jgi:protein TonB
MAREGLRSHLSGSVPVSIAVHVVVLFVLVVIPLLDIVLPLPAATMETYVLAAPAPPPPPVLPIAVPRSTLSRPVSGPPTTAPDAIRPEVPTPPPSTPTGNVDSGLPAGFGAEGAVPTPVPPPVAPAEPARPQPGPVRAAQLPEMPRKVVDVHPVYPEIARSARIEGTVVLEAVVDTAGRVTQLRVLRSVPLLDQAALDAVRQWRYTPSQYYGRPVSVLMTVTVRFTLQP